MLGRCYYCNQLGHRSNECPQCFQTNLVEVTRDEESEGQYFVEECDKENEEVKLVVGDEGEIPTCFVKCIEIEELPIREHIAIIIQKLLLASKAPKILSTQ